MSGVTGAELTAVNFTAPLQISFRRNGDTGLGQAGMDAGEGLVRFHRVPLALAQKIFARIHACLTEAGISVPTE